MHTLYSFIHKTYFIILYIYKYLSIYIYEYFIYCQLSQTLYKSW